eukprot:TRINITY_DN110808_c0_g1_i1.p1 TRINITY_DN110808_c0_g1~~TRINITY_DN110808_c0_g1_i1.p1  ORF type:complete len:420 (+),score=50.22 TRINITY_DN110808_c0_g1_i1:722-1981(+)
MCILSLAPMPSDRAFTRAVLVVCCILVVIDGLFDYLDLQGYKYMAENDQCTMDDEHLGNNYCWLKCVGNGFYCVKDASMLLYFAWIGPRRVSTLPTETMQVKMDEFWLYVPPEVLGYFVVTRPEARRIVQGYIRRLFEAHGTTAAAAGLASLVGDMKIGEVISQARLRFKGIGVESLCMEDLRLSAVRSPSSGTLAHLSCHLRLGCCDAFVSHSWHDQSESKWQAMQGWRAAFHVLENREPIIWFDKACIDQNRIEDDLRFLPVFLSGCKELLILCGRTYLKRLWCVVELFTFVHMGGNIDRIKLIPLLRVGHELEDSEEIRDAFLNFDARNCECSVYSDKTIMLSIIDAAFGDMCPFNGIVRNIIVDVGFSQNLDSVLDTESLFSSMGTDPTSSECALGKDLSHGSLTAVCNCVPKRV